MSEPFVAYVNREKLRHALKMWAVGLGCGTNDIIQQFEYTPDMSTLIPYEDFLGAVDFTLGNKPYDLDLDSLIEGSQSTIDLLSSFADLKCDALMLLYESYIRRLNDKFEMQVHPNKIPKHN